MVSIIQVLTLDEVVPGFEISGRFSKEHLPKLPPTSGKHFEWRSIGYNSLWSNFVLTYVEPYDAALVNYSHHPYVHEVDRVTPSGYRHATPSELLALAFHHTQSEDRRQWLTVAVIGDGTTDGIPFFMDNEGFVQDRDTSLGHSSWYLKRYLGVHSTRGVLQGFSFLIVKL
jgi:hypothetical protein